MFLIYNGAKWECNLTVNDYLMLQQNEPDREIFIKRIENEVPKTIIVLISETRLYTAVDDRIHTIYLN